MTTRQSLDEQWRTSSYSSQGGNCVEVALTGTSTSLRDTKNRAAGSLTVASAAFLGLHAWIARSR